MTIDVWAVRAPLAPIEDHVLQNHGLNRPQTSFIAFYNAAEMLFVRNAALPPRELAKTDSIPAQPT